MSLGPEERARGVRVIVFKVDGVLTDGQTFVLPENSSNDANGIEVKGFAAQDGLGILLAHLGGLRVGIITRDHSRSASIRASELKIDFVYQGQAQKLAAAEEIAIQAGITMDQLAYVGDDIVDLPLMRACGLAIATANARPQVKAAAHVVTLNRGGQGAARDAIDFVLAAQGALDRVIDEYIRQETPAGPLPKWLVEPLGAGIGREVISLQSSAENTSSKFRYIGESSNRSSEFLTSLRPAEVKV